MISVENLTKQYGDVRAVSELSFEVDEGEILGFLGPNGAGKTTTMRILTCFFPPTSGRARIAGFDVVEDPHEVRRIIGYLPEGVPLYREMTVESALDFVAHAKGFNKQARRRHVDLAVEETNLGKVRHRIIGHLSKGFRQRVGLAQAILGDPKVLILDEPTVGLDPRQIAEVRALIKAMAGKRTVILSTHILPEVQMTCSRVLIVNEGRIAAMGTPEHLTQQQNRGESVARVRGAREAVTDSLRRISGVTNVRVADVALTAELVGEFDYHVLYEPPTQNLNPAIVRALSNGGFEVLEVRRIGVTLEEVFLKAVAGEPEPVSVASATLEADLDEEGSGNVA